jgi:Arc/MetJ family transcription regulator
VLGTLGGPTSGVGGGLSAGALNEAGATLVSAVRAFVHTQRCANLTHRSPFEMRTNIDIDDRLMRRAMRSVNSRTKRGAVEAGLRLLIQTRGQTGIRRLRGKIRWHGDLSRSRRGRTSS